MKNADTITTKEIRALREEAKAHRDYVMADWCDVALAAHETADSEGCDLLDPVTGEATCRSQAREICADAINAAVHS